MMDIVITVAFMGLPLLFVSPSIWFLHCNNKTYDQRHEMIYAYPHPDKWEIFNSVTYSQHLWALFFFRNPYELYHKPSALEQILNRGINK